MESLTWWNIEILKKLTRSERWKGGRGRQVAIYAVINKTPGQCDQLVKVWTLPIGGLAICFFVGTKPYWDKMKVFPIQPLFTGRVFGFHLCLNQACTFPIQWSVWTFIYFCFILNYHHIAGYKIQTATTQIPVK